jgi:transcriptional regulator with XRE-family HTH domain
MAVAHIPADTFSCRLAILRADAGGLNVKQAADRCGFSDQSWRNWEAGRRPRDYENTCRRLADIFGVDLAWIALGGPLVAPSTTWYLTQAAA